MELVKRDLTVDLLQRTCSCRSWQLNGIPCNHATASIWLNKERPEHYVSSWYYKETYTKAYASNIEPLNGPQEWPRNANEPICMPPNLKKATPHRPKVKRRAERGELYC